MTESHLSKSDYVALANFRRGLRRFLRYSEEGARQVGLTPQQHQTLLAVKGQPNRDWASIKEIAEALQVKHQTAVGLIDRCAAAGLVRRETDPNDRRQVRVLLEEHGEKLLEQLSARNLAELARIQNSMRLILPEFNEPVEHA